MTTRNYVRTPVGPKNCATDGCHDPLPVVILLAALEYRDSAEDMDKDRVNTFKLC